MAKEPIDTTAGLEGTAKSDCIMGTFLTVFLARSHLNRSVIVYYILYSYLAATTSNIKIPSLDLNGSFWIFLKVLFKKKFTF